MLPSTSNSTAPLLRLALKGPVRARDSAAAGITRAYLQRLRDRLVLEREVALTDWLGTCPAVSTVSSPNAGLAKAANVSKKSLSRMSIVSHVFTDAGLLVDEGL